MALDVAIDMVDARWADAWPDAAHHVEKLCFHVLQAEGIARNDKTIEISFLMTDDDQVRALNKAYRGKDAPTNVLSFPSGDQLDGDDFVGFGPPVLLGDIALAFDTVAREARDKDLALPDHAAHLVVHGVLHLLGFDHQSDGEAEVMEAKEIEFCRDFGIANPYGPFL